MVFENNFIYVDNKKKLGNCSVESMNDDHVNIEFTQQQSFYVVNLKFFTALNIYWKIFFHNLEVPLHKEYINTSLPQVKLGN